MDIQALAAALRNKAAEVKNINVESQDDYNLLRDASDLLRVLAHVVDGKSLEKALGAPGDWGYETQIGQAIASATRPTSPPSAHSEKGNDMDASLKETILHLWNQGSNAWVISQRSGAAESDVINVIEEEQKSRSLKKPNA